MSEARSSFYTESLPIQIYEIDELYHCGIDYIQHDESKLGYHRVICDYQSKDFFDVAKHLYDVHLKPIRKHLKESRK